jgi:hypothetical protein
MGASRFRVTADYSIHSGPLSLLATWLAEVVTLR